MTPAQATQRFRMLVVLALAAALALGSFWVLEVMRRGANDYIPDVARTEPDYYVEQFSYVKMSETGTPKYHVSGDKLTHNPVDDTYNIAQPRLKNLVPDRPATTVRAERARINSEGTEMHLYDQVHLDRPESPGSQRLQVRSDFMLVLPDDEVAKTDQAVTITLGPSTLKGVGMYANNATRELRLASSVQGRYVMPGAVAPQPN